MTATGFLSRGGEEKKCEVIMHGSVHFPPPAPGSPRQRPDLTPGDPFAVVSVIACSSSCAIHLNHRTRRLKRDSSND